MDGSGPGGDERKRLRASRKRGRLSLKSSAPSTAGFQSALAYVQQRESDDDSGPAKRTRTNNLVQNQHTDSADSVRVNGGADLPVHPDSERRQGDHHGENLGDYGWSNTVLGRAIDEANQSTSYPERDPSPPGSPVLGGGGPLKRFKSGNASRSRDQTPGGLSPIHGASEPFDSTLYLSARGGDLQDAHTSYEADDQEDFTSPRARDDDERRGHFDHSSGSANDEAPYNVDTKVFDPWAGGHNTASINLSLEDMDQYSGGQSGGALGGPVGQAAVGQRFRAAYGAGGLIDGGGAGLAEFARRTAGTAAGQPLDGHGHRHHHGEGDRAGRHRRGLGGDDAQGGGSGGGAGRGSVAANAGSVPLLRSADVSGKYTLTFRNKFIIKSWAYSGKVVKTDAAIVKEYKNDKILAGTSANLPQPTRCTSLAMLPVMHVAFYLSPVEWEMLPESSRVLKAGVRVIPLGNTVSFDYGSSLAGSATSEHVVLYARAKGLESKLPVYPFWYAPTTADPMKIESATRVHKYSNEQENNTWDHVFKKLWGSDDDEVDEDFSSVDLAVRHFNTYAAYSLPVIAKGIGHWRLDRHVDVFPADALMGSPIIEWEYVPENGTVKWPDWDKYCTQDYSRVSLNVTGATKRKLFMFTGGEAKNEPYKEEVTATSNVVYNEMAIENGDWIFNDINKTVGDSVFKKEANLPYFGILPIQANTGGADNTSQFVRASTTWQVETSITIECKHPSSDHTMHEYAPWGSFLGFCRGTYNGADRFYAPRYYGAGLNPDLGCQPHIAAFDVSKKATVITQNTKLKDQWEKDEFNNTRV